jgi:hypothetical protein
MTIGGGEASSIARTTEQILDTHCKVREMTRRLEEVADLVELQARLQAFRSLLVPHFAEEEAPDGFFDLVRAETSRHLAKVRELENEHDALLHEIDTLASAPACLAGPVAEILRQSAGLAQRVREHEARESALLVDALYVDVGGQ